MTSLDSKYERRNNDILKWLKSNELRDESKRKIVIVMGSSCSGKSTVCQILKNELKERAYVIPIYTTRDKRDKGESEHYRFVTVEEFEDLKLEVSANWKSEYGVKSYGFTFEDFEDSEYLILDYNDVFLEELLKSDEVVERFELLIIDLGVADIEFINEVRFQNSKTENARRLKSDIEARDKSLSLMLENKGKYELYSSYYPSKARIKININSKSGLANAEILSNSPLEYKKVGGSSLAGMVGKHPYSNPLKVACNLLRIEAVFHANKFANAGLIYEDIIIDKLYPEGVLKFTYEEYKGNMFGDSKDYGGLIDGYEVNLDLPLEVKTYFNPFKFKATRYMKTHSEIINGRSYDIYNERGLPFEYLLQVYQYMYLLKKYCKGLYSDFEKLRVIAYPVNNEELKRVNETYYDECLIRNEVKLDVKKENIDLSKLLIYDVNYDKEKIDKVMNSMTSILNSWIEIKSDRFHKLSIQGFKADKKLLEFVNLLQTESLKYEYLNMSVEVEMN